MIKADIAVAHQVHFEVLFTLEVIWKENHEILLGEAFESNSLYAEELLGD